MLRLIVIVFRFTFCTILGRPPKPSDVKCEVSEGYFERGIVGLSWTAPSNASDISHYYVEVTERDREAKVILSVNETESDTVLKYNYLNRFNVIASVSVVNKCGVMSNATMMSSVKIKPNPGLY